MKNIKHAPLALLSAFVLKALLLGASYPELGVIAVLGAFAAYSQKALKDAFEKDMAEKLDAASKRFEAVDSHITQMYKNDQEMLIQLKKLALPAAVKSNGFGRMNG